ncbi:hypothetical protein ATJ88_2431 [Isoptericola jiangsuensis]|uniref:DhaL domain-containing protein n=1 Tax=Isoptericola jiangsuensis TaxID=548579 RepID=A0A2A9EXF8_9MICO|nr:DAK2 domain-containing protein [Isoptericola jiangsuensis]PFG43724.1 hypothetical protein ATJ88_2431 [Isoptericola jiangsuensis]
MERPELIDPDVVRTWLRAATAALGASRADLDRVNVFPVADGDTGTNMYLTVREASAAVHEADEDASGRRLLRLAARAALLGARGNSGVILSEWFRGLAVAASRGDGLGPGLDVAARSARQAVARPAPGTILTAAESAAAAARHAEAGGMVGPLGSPTHLPVLDAARRGAREAALRSVGALAPLRDAGVLDAGACGLVLVLDALAAARRHVDLVAQGLSEADASMGTVLLDMDLRGHRPPPDADPAAPAPDTAEHAAADEVELMFVLHRPHHASGFRPGAVADALRADLDEVGDSVVVVGGSDGGDDDADSLWQAHVHTPDLETALEVPRRWARRGAVSRVYVRHLAVAAEDWAVVVTTSAPRLAAELASGGAVVLLDLDTAPTVDDVAQTVLGTGAPHVLVLAPGDVLDADRLARATATIRSRDVERDGRPAAPGPEVTVVAADDDVHLVTAVAALAGALDVAGDGAPPDVPQVVRAALARLRTARTSAAEAVGTLGTLVAGVVAPGIVALLPDADLPAGVLDDLEDAATALASDADVVVLPTGRPGSGVGIGVEPAEDATAEPVGAAAEEETR